MIMTNLKLKAIQKPIQLYLLNTSLQQVHL